MNKKTNPSFDLEKSLTELESIVSHMERNTLGIESALAEFEKGIKIIRSCQNALQQAEQRVKVLVEKNGEAVLIDHAIDENTETSQNKQSALDVDHSD